MAFLSFSAFLAAVSAMALLFEPQGTVDFDCFVLLLLFFPLLLLLLCESSGGEAGRSGEN